MSARFPSVRISANIKILLTRYIDILEEYPYLTESTEPYEALFAAQAVSIDRGLLRVAINIPNQTSEHRDDVAHVMQMDKRLFCLGS